MSISRSGFDKLIPPEERPGYVKPPQGKISPGQGGCWFCYRDDGDDLVLDSEWDTFVHVSCVRAVLAKNPDHPEAHCMKYLLGEY